MTHKRHQSELGLNGGIGRIIFETANKPVSVAVVLFFMAFSFHELDIKRCGMISHHLRNVIVFTNICRFSFTSGNFNFV